MFCSELIYKVPAGKVLLSPFWQLEYFSLLPLGCDTQRDVAEFVLARLFNFVVQLFQGIHRLEHLPLVLGELKVKSNSPCSPKD